MACDSDSGMLDSMSFCVFCDLELPEVSIESSVSGGSVMCTSVVSL